MEKIIEVVPGQTILEQGEEGSGFFVLKSGTLEVFKDDVLLAVIMYPGTIFGEMGDILGRPRTCTVKAKNTSIGIFCIRVALPHLPPRDVVGFSMWDMRKGELE